MDGTTQGNYDMDEREEMDAAQAALGELKKHLRNVRKINEEAGRIVEANEAFIALSQLNVWHGKITRALHKHWPEHATEIQTRGPGGR